MCNDLCPPLLYHRCWPYQSFPRTDFGFIDLFYKMFVFCFVYVCFIISFHLLTLGLLPYSNFSGGENTSSSLSRLARFPWSLHMAPQASPHATCLQCLILIPVSYSYFLFISASLPPLLSVPSHLTDSADCVLNS